VVRTGRIIGVVLKGRATEPERRGPGLQERSAASTLYNFSTFPLLQLTVKTPKLNVDTYENGPVK